MKNRWGETPLKFATRNDHSAVVVLLLQQPGIDVNARDEDGDTALHHAWIEPPESLKLLLQDE